MSNSNQIDFTSLSVAESEATYRRLHRTFERGWIVYFGGLIFSMIFAAPVMKSLPSWAEFLVVVAAFAYPTLIFMWWCRPLKTVLRSLQQRLSVDKVAEISKNYHDGWPSVRDCIYPAFITLVFYIGITILR